MSWSNISQTSGIYSIRNTRTDECYVGSTTNFRSRMTQHRRHLSHGKHHSPRLQAAFQAEDPNVFVPEILEECGPDKATLKEREDYWIKAKNSYAKGYNTTPTAYSTRGYRHTAEQLARAAVGRQRAQAERDGFYKIWSFCLLILTLWAWLDRIWRGGQPSPLLPLAIELHAAPRTRDSLNQTTEKMLALLPALLSDTPRPTS